MKRNYPLLCSITLALLSTGAPSSIAEDQAPVKQEAIPALPAPLQAEARIAIQKEVMVVLHTPGTPAQEAITFSRVRVVPRSLDSYSVALTDSAPGGVKVDPSHVPFEVQQPSFKSDSPKPTTYLSGFYDANTKTVQLYSAAAKSYVAAADHPYLKARAAKK